MDQDDRDDTMLEERLAGRSVVAIAKQHRCTTSDVDALIDRRLNYDLNNDLRLKAIKLDCARLEALMVPFFECATKDRDMARAVAAGTLCCKLLERRALLLGLDQPTQSRIDIFQIRPPEVPSSHERIKQAILRVARGSNGQQPSGNSIDAIDAVPDAANGGSDPQ